MTRTLRALPTLLRIGVAETVAYRAEFLVWILTTTQPLIMLALWTSVAREAPFENYSSRDFVAYYLATLIVRNLTGSWVVWQINEEVRQGQMSMRLLRPVHPFVQYAASHVAAVPLRGLVALPVTAIMLATSARASITHDPAQIALFLVSVGVAWMLTFAFLFALGSCAFFLDKGMSLMEVYFGVFAIFSGYLIPLPLLPGWLQSLAGWLPFRFMLAAPVEILTRPATLADHLIVVAEQVAWASGVLFVALAIWRAGVRRFEAVGV